MSAVRKRKAVPGLVEPNEKTPFYGYDFVVERVRHCGSLRTENRAEAIRLLRGKRRDAKDAAVFRRQALERNDMTWEDAAERYFESMGDYSHLRVDRNRVRWVTEQLGEGRLVSEITDKDIAALFKTAKGLTRWGREGERTLRPSTVNLYVEIVRRVLRHVKLDHGVVLPHEPRVQRHFLEVQPRVREMMIAEEFKLEPVRPDLWPVAQFILHTGLRREAAFLGWDQVNLAEGVMKVVSKGNKVQEVPIIPEIEELLLDAWGKNAEKVWTWKANRTWRHGQTGQVFVKGEYYPLRPRSFESAWRRMREKAGVKDLRVHDIRKTTGARMIRATGDLLNASRRLNHARVDMTARHYAHVTRDDERKRMSETAEATRQWKERHIALTKGR